MCVAAVHWSAREVNEKQKQKLNNLQLCETKVKGRLGFDWKDN